MAAAAPAAVAAGTAAAVEGTNALVARAESPVAALVAALYRAAAGKLVAAETCMAVEAAVAAAAVPAGAGTRVRTAAAWAAAAQAGSAAAAPLAEASSSRNLQAGWTCWHFGMAGWGIFVMLHETVPHMTMFSMRL